MVDSEFTVFCNAAAAHAPIKNEDVLTWYKEQQLHLTMLSCLATIIFSIHPFQAENDRDLYLAGIYISNTRTRLSLDMISSLLFFNRHSRVTPPEKYIYLFEVSTDHIQYKIYDMERSFDFSNKSNSEDLRNLTT